MFDGAVARTGGQMDSIFGELERFGSEVIYPYRWLFLVLAVVAIAVFLTFASRREWHLVLWRHKFVSAAVGVPLLAIVIPLGFYTLSPLWERTFLEEAAPEFDRGALVEAGVPTSTPIPEVTVSAGETPPPEPTAAAAAGGDEMAALVAFGEWQGADDFHFAEGQALILETEPGVYILRLENFSVRNGPDLFVYLSHSADGYESEAVNLGDLKATDGAFNYEIPADLDVGEFKSAIVWCKRFSVLFGHASLMTVAP